MYCDLLFVAVRKTWRPSTEKRCGNVREVYLLENQPTFRTRPPQRLGMGAVVQ